jgi:hypothetical protein
MKDEDKLRVLIPHWMRHNDEHGAEFRRWVDQAGAAAADIEAAAVALARVNEALAAALEKLGGALEHDDAHHH